MQREPGLPGEDTGFRGEGDGGARAKEQRFIRVRMVVPVEGAFPGNGSMRDGNPSAPAPETPVK